MIWLRVMLAGGLSILLFQQGMLALLYVGRLASFRPWALHAAWPFGWPSVLTTAAFGCVLALPLWASIRGHANAMHWLRAIVLGALLGAVLELLVLPPLRSQAFAIDLDTRVWVRAVLLYGAWGFGVAALVQGFGRR